MRLLLDKSDIYVNEFNIFKRLLQKEWKIYTIKRGKEKYKISNSIIVLKDIKK